MIRNAVAAVAVLSVAGAASASVQGYIIPTGGNPDPIFTFDLENPSSLTQIGSAAGNFNRGMDINSPTNGFILQTSNALSNPDTRGLYKFNPTDGSVAFLADPFGQDLAAGGDLTFDSTGSFLYATSGDDLWQIGFDGSGTLLGTIQVDGQDAGTIPGLTLDPATGALIGYRSTADDIITIDPNTLTGTVVGALGINAAAVGSLDATPDGRVVLSTNSSGDLWEVNTSTGAVGTLLGSTGENVSALAFEIPAPGAIGVLGLAGLAVARRRRA
ncbi:MAG: hypothetical protein AAGD00_07525 [Planctomycetota bacterium]